MGYKVMFRDNQEISLIIWNDIKDWEYNDVMLLFQRGKVREGFQES